MSKGVPLVRRASPALMVAALLLADCKRTPPIGSAPSERAPPLFAAGAAGPPAFVGRWASSKAACAERPWVLQTGELRSPGVLSCQFVHVDPTTAGYTVLSVCTVGKVAEPTRLAFTLTGEGDDRSLTLSGGPFAEPAPLTWCDDKVAAGPGNGGG
jgi:hypothetical protein